MFRHVVMFRLSDEMTEEQKEAFRSGLARMPEVIPEIRAYRFGEDAGLHPDNYDFVVTADFDDAAGFAVYRDHPDHKGLVAELVGPFVMERAAAQFSWPTALPTDLPG